LSSAVKLLAWKGLDRRQTGSNPHERVVAISWIETKRCSGKTTGQHRAFSVNLTPNSPSSKLPLTRQR